jgi:hypothetical protein
LQCKKLSQPRLYVADSSKEKEKQAPEKAQRGKEEDESRAKKASETKAKDRRSGSEALTDSNDKRKGGDREGRSEKKGVEFQETRSLVRLGKTKSVDKDSKSSAWPVRSNRKSESNPSRGEEDDADEHTLDANGQPVNPSILRAQSATSRRISIGRKKSDGFLSHSSKEDAASHLLSISLPNLPEKPSAGAKDHPSPKSSPKGSPKKKVEENETKKEEALMPTLKMEEPPVPENKSEVPTLKEPTKVHDTSKNVPEKKLNDAVYDMYEAMLNTDSDAKTKIPTR